MKLRSLSTRILVVLTVLSALAFNGDATTFYFSVSSGEIFAPGDPGTSIEYSGNNVGATTLYLRAFRIDNPVEFFEAQTDPHSPSLLALDPPNTFDMIGMGLRKVSRDMRYAARDVMPPEARRTIRDVADINGTRAAKKDSAAAAAAAKLDKNAAPQGDIPKGAEGYKVVDSWEYKIVSKNGEEDENWHYDKIAVPLRQKGVYLIEARARGSRAITVLIISEYGMVVKQSKTEALAFVVNTKSGEKVAGMPLSFRRGGEKINEGETNANGTLLAKLPPLAEMKNSQGDESEEEDWRWEYRRRQMLIMGLRDDNFVISDPYYYSYDDGNSKIYLHTDRPVYRPGQTVYWRGIYRTVNDDGTYKAPTGTDSVIVVLENAQGTQMRADTVRLSDAGTFNGEVALDSEAPLGDYSIKVRGKGSSSSSEEYFSFEVEEYKKPEYKVVVEADKAIYTRGDVITATAKANYFFGSPVVNADVEYFVYRALYWRPWWYGSDWAFLYDAGDDDFSVYRMEMVSSGKGRLESDGSFKVIYKSDSAADRDYVYRVQVNVVDNSRRSIAGSKSVQVTRGEFSISMRSDRYVYKPGDEVKLSTEMKTFDGNRPVSTGYTTRVTSTWWEKVRNDSTEGGFDYKRRTRPVWSGTAKTGADGRGSTVWRPDSAGYYQVEITARDTRGTDITESNYLYVADASYANWYRDGSSDVQIIPDKEAYKPGETMSALVIMPAANIDALITLEGAAIFNQRVERLSGTSAIVRFEMEARHAPNVYLSASAIVNGEMYTDSKRIGVVPEGRLLHLDVKADREVYRPGDKGSVAIRALDESGAPVANVDVAMGMVDEAIYSIRPDATPDIQRSFYGGHWNEVETSSSLNFAFYGSARRIDADATDALYGSLNHRRTDDLAGGRPGSRLAGRALSFGDIKGEMFVQPAVRKNFKDMMSWTPSVRTDADGRATVQVVFPDNLTTWRMTAFAVGPNTSVGATSARVVARKDLMVRMETPRFMIEGDELLIATTVHNYLKTEKATKVEFSGENLTLAERERTVTIPANGETRIDWKVTATKSGEARLTVKALTNEESDAMELPIPVLPRGMQLSTGGSAEITEPTGSRTMNLQIPEGGDVSTAALYLNVAPSLAGAVLGSLDGLIGYPYGCVEQTMSRFLPTIVVADVLKQLNVPFPDTLRAKIPKMVARGLTKLNGMQHDDGGWGWWENDQTDAYMTAYVVYGLGVARKSGVEIGNVNIESGKRSLRTMLEAGVSPDKQKIDATTEALMLYALSISKDPGFTSEKLVIDRVRALARRDTISDYARALLALTANDQGMRADATALVASLEKRVVLDENYAHWGGVQQWDWKYDPVETSAMAVRAINDLRGETEIVKKGVRWLLSQKSDDGWHNTRQTATVIYSLVDLLRSSGELAPNYTVTVKVNGTEVYTKQMKPADVFAKETRVKLDGVTFRPGANSVVIEKNGTGRLYAAARLNYYATGTALRPTSAGFRVQRDYWLLRRERRGELLVYTKQPFTGTVKSGDELFVRVKVTPERSAEFVMVEDPLPAGCEVVDNTAGYTIVGEPEYDAEARKKAGLYSWSWWYSSREVRDEKVAFFARTMSLGDYTFSYVMRAQIPGRYSVMPTVGSLMYYPEVRGNGTVLALNVTQ